MKRLLPAALLGAIALASSVGAHLGCGASPTTCPEAETAAAPAPGAMAERPKDYAVRVHGLVRQPVTMTRSDLMSHQSVTMRLNDVKRDGTFGGVFKLRGVPLRALLDLAHIEKKSSVFNREMDLAIVVRGASGEEALLSWGEIYYRNPSDFVLAYDSTGLLPHKDCASCHEPETFEPWKNQILRQVPYPKLVASRDRFSDRSIEAVTSIEVVELGADRGHQVEKGKGPKDMRAEEISLADSEGVRREISTFDGLERITARAIQAGDGTGFHGIREYEGVSLRDALAQLGYGPDPAAGFVMSARDGYRVLLSSAEIFSSGGDDVLLADTMNGAPLSDSGRYQLVLVADQSADRWLKAVATIDPVRPPQEAKLPTAIR